MIKTEQFEIPTTWHDLSVTQARNLVEWTKSGNEDKVKLLSILLNISESVAAKIRASDGEAVLMAVMDTLNDAIEMPDVPKKILGYSTDINVNNLTMRQMQHMDNIIKELKVEGILSVCSKVVAVCLCTESDEAIDKLIERLDDEPVTIVKTTADFFLTKFNAGLTSQINQSLLRNKHQSKFKQGQKTLTNMVSLILSGHLPKAMPQRMSR